jgi:hypothetical protein
MGVTDTNLNAAPESMEYIRGMTDGDRAIKVRILALALLGFLLSVKSDGYFPLPEHLSEPVFQTLLILYTCFFFAAFIIFIKPGIPGDTLSFLDRISAIRLTTVIILVFEAMALILLIVQDIRYALFGYHLNIPITLFLFTCIGIALVYLLFWDASQDLLFFIALAAYIGTYLLSIISFPLNPQRSDMLPLILSGCQSFLAGMTPYGYHTISHRLVFTYLPGMWMAYLPAAASGTDPRFINLMCMVISVLILAYSAKGSRNYTMLLIPVFLLTPYLQYRHEIYLGVLFLILSIIFSLYSRNRWLISSIVFGYALATYQLVWVIYPFGVVAAFRKWGIKKAMMNILIAFAIALILILPFLLGSPDYFIKGVYGHWLYVDILSVNLSYLVSLVVPWDLMIFIQGIVMAIIFAVALQRMDSADCWGWMATALVLFIALNRVIEVYLYLLVLLLLVMHGISKRAPSKMPEP